MGEDYIEIRLDAPVDAGELLAYLPGREAVGAWENGGTICLYWPKRLWAPHVAEDLQCALRRLGVDIGICDVFIREVVDRDWNELWMKSIRPVLIGSHVFVRQSWNPAKAPIGVIELIIDPKRAFGSGFHATTQLLVQWVAEIAGTGGRVLDVGTGSGILAMTALRAGAAQAVGLDTDEMAIECARENAALNNFGPELELRVGTVEALGARKFDIILANIDRKTLLSCAGNLGNNLVANGRLLLSGLQETDRDELSEALAGAGGRIIEMRRLEEWLAMAVAFGHRGPVA
jgi:ribosomal protein L11 methyltransferase